MQRAVSVLSTGSDDSRPARILHFPHLDGLRALAALAVILAHFDAWLKFPATASYRRLRDVMTLNGVSGSVGVCFFLVLSGFLITYLMFVERERTGRFSIKRFYLRRLLRIWPLYFMTVFVGFYLYPWFDRSGYHENASGLLYSLFLTNFDHIYHGPPTAPVLGVQWSVAVEEQFYLIWPLVFVGTGRKAFPLAMTGIIAVSSLFYAHNYANMVAQPTYFSWAVGYYHILSAMAYLAMGALLAHLCFHRPQVVEGLLTRLTKPAILGLYVLGFLLLSHRGMVWWTLGIPPTLFPHLDRLGSALFFCFVIAEQNYARNSVFKIGRSRVLSWLGTISYGLYLNHMIAICIIIKLSSGQPVLVQMFLALALTVLISYLSYRYYERPFLSLKERARTKDPPPFRARDEGAATP